MRGCRWAEDVELAVLVRETVLRAGALRTTVRVTGAGSVMYCTVGTAAGANAVVPKGVVPDTTAGAVTAAGCAAFTEELLVK
jgi:hypothetical protein